MAKLVTAGPHGLGYLEPAAFDQTVSVLLSGASAPVITKTPTGAWSHAVIDRAGAVK